MLLLVSSRHHLLAAYGPKGLDAIEAAIDRYQAVLAEEGTPSRFVMVDDFGAMAPFALEPLSALDPASIGGAIRAVAARLATDGEAVTAIALVGGNAIIPFWRVLNPVTDRLVDPDPVVLTDNPYGAREDTLSAWLSPAVPVGRFCAADGSAPEGLATLFEDAAQNHKSRPLRQGSCAVVNEEWLDASMRAGNSLTQPVAWRLAPGFRVTSGNLSDLDARFLYFNLHGFSGEPGWKGYHPAADRFVTALTPDSFSRQHVAGSLVFAENCYGAEVVGRTAADSCALQLLEMGAGAFVGSTGLAFGSFLEPESFLINADQLAQFFFRHAAAGTPAGLSLALARAEYFDFAKRDTLLDPFEQKTALQFVLLGDPAFV